MVARRTVAEEKKTREGEGGSNRIKKQKEGGGGGYVWNQNTKGGGGKNHT